MEQHLTIAEVQHQIKQQQMIQALRDENKQVKELLHFGALLIFNCFHFKVKTSCRVAVKLSYGLPFQMLLYRTEQVSISFLIRMDTKRHWRFGLWMVICVRHLFFSL